MNVNLQVELAKPEAIALMPGLLQATRYDDDGGEGTNNDAYFAVTASRLTLVAASTIIETSSSSLSPAYAAIFLPATITESALGGKTDFILLNGANSGDNAKNKFSKRLLAMVHPFLAENFSIKGLLQVRNNDDNHHHYHNAPADIALVDLTHTPTSLLHELLQITNGQVIHAGQPELILKVLMINSLKFAVKEAQQSKKDDDDHDAKPAAATAAIADKQVLTSAPAPTTLLKQRRQQSAQLELPSCPVCIHRIDPLRLGLPKPETHQLCSKFCTPPNLLLVASRWSVARKSSSALSTGTTTTTTTTDSARVACPRQRLLLPWPSPSHCTVCRIIDQYWQDQVSGETTTTTLLRCGMCQMQQTLWICLTCGFLGCGRYSNQHAADHFVDTGHTFSLELATLRIWDYVTSGFVQRTDLLECPSSWPLLQPWVAPLSPVRPAALAASSITMEKAPKKATMIGEEYEALLQSALEEQAQHYEGELTHLHAQLTAEHVDQSSLSAAERLQVDALQAEIAALRMDVDRVGKELLDAQAQQAAQKNQSQALLREQQVAQDIVKQLEQETAHERAVGRQQVEELEQQIADLTANQRMRHEFQNNEELQQAQIWGMAASNNNNNTPNARGKKGKKQRRVRK